MEINIQAEEHFSSNALDFIFYFLWLPKVMSIKLRPTYFILFMNFFHFSFFVKYPNIYLDWQNCS